MNQPCTALTTIESSRLGELEEIIESGLQTFVEVGKALMEIRESRLYRIEHSRFEDYCRERWGFKRAQAYRLMESADIVGQLSPIGDIPATESQARELASVPKSEVQQVWERAIPPPRTSAPLRPDAFTLTRSQIFELVEGIRKEAAKDLKTRRVAKGSWLTAFSNGAYCAFDEAALRVLEAAKLSLKDYHSWRANK